MKWQLGGEETSGRLKWRLIAASTSAKAVGEEKWRRRRWRSAALESAKLARRRK